MRVVGEQQWLSDVPRAQRYDGSQFNERCDPAKGGALRYSEVKKCLTSALKRLNK